MFQEDYLSVAREHELVFRAILKDLVSNREHRPRGQLVPSDISLERSLDALYEVLSLGERTNKFTIVSFKRQNPEKATIGFESMGERGGKGIELAYQILSDHEVAYKEDIMDWELRV